MGNCLPCLYRKDVDRRSARQSYFDAKLAERETVLFTRSEYNKVKKNNSFKLRYRAHRPKKPQ